MSIFFFKNKFSIALGLLVIADVFLVLMLLNKLYNFIPKKQINLACIIAYTIAFLFLLVKYISDKEALKKRMPAK